jgi:hypothetical protein
MRHFPGAGVRRFASAWWFWAVVLIALPNCAFDSSGTGGPLTLAPSDLPHTSAVMCDIRKYQPIVRCATPQDLEIGIPFAEAAEALVDGRTSNVGLDYSPEAQEDCGDGTPKAIDFFGAFPEGTVVCLNCEAIGTEYANATEVCIAQCQDLVERGDGPFPPDILSFCTATARPSTHFPAAGCFENACTEGGTLRTNFDDPRRIPDPVVWRDRIGTAAFGSDLTQTSPSTMGNVFGAGAVSEQWIDHGDGYVEFHASETNLSHVIGFAEVPAACAFPCEDSDPGFEDIAFALSLNLDGRVYLLERGLLVMGPDLNGSFGTYFAGERFRVRVKDNFDGTATVRYTRIIGACAPGTTCNESPIFEQVADSAAYPLRAAAAFREQNATLAAVDIVRLPVQ